MENHNEWSMAMIKVLIIRVANICLAALLCMVFVSAAAATSHYVSTSGSSSGDGSLTSPWDLQTALNQPASVQPGDTIWILQGTYQSLPAGSYGFVSNLNGTASSPIIVRNYNGGRATIDGMSDTIALAIEGSYTWFWGLEIMSSITNRVSTVSGSFGEPNALGVTVYGSGIKCINMIVHDTAQGFSAYNSAPNGEFSGNLSYYNGWIGPDRNHGHGFYLQNSTGTKLVHGNFSGDNADEGTQLYGSGGADIEGITYEYNSVYNNSSWPTAQYQYNLLLGGGDLDTNNTVSNNYFYFTPNVTSGYEAIGIYAPGSNLTVSNNVFAGGYIGFSTNGVVAPFTFTGNEIYVSPTAGEAWTVEQGLFSGQSSSGYHWDYNNYYGLDVFEANCTYDGTNISGCTSENFFNWESTTGFDTHGTYSSSAPTGTQIFVIPNEYEAKRANIVIYNWNLSATVAVDLSNILTVGGQYLIQDAQNFYGPAVVSGTYTGGVVEIPMTGLTKATPIGFATPPQTAPEYGTFVVMVPGAGASGPPGTPTINWTTPAAITYGTALSATQLNATAAYNGTSVPGTFAYSPVAGTVLGAGDQTISVNFTPTDTTDYTTAAATVTLQVNRAIPTVSFTGAPATAPYRGTFTVAATTNASTTAVATASGSCSIAGATVTISAPSGTCSLSATWAADSNYLAASATQATSATKAMPKITWAKPAAITYGTALSGTQLDATASVPGTFVYAPVKGTVLGAGAQTLSVAFTPNDTTDYTTATDSVTITVNKTTSSTALTSNTPNPSLAGQAVTVSFSVTGAGTPTGSVTVTASTRETCSGTLNSGKGSCTLTFVASGKRTLTAAYAGDTNFKNSASAKVTEVVH